MARKAVATTLAAVALLTMLVVADVSVVSAQEDLASSAQLAQVATREKLLEQAYGGVAALGLLTKVQAFLNSSVAQCANLTQYVESISASMNVSGEDSGITYSVNASGLGQQPSALPVADNLSLVAPFAGYLPGALGIQTQIAVHEESGSVSLDKHEGHALNLPIMPGSASSLCLSTSSSLGAALARSPCNATIEALAFYAVLPGLVASASGLGFSLTAGWGSSGACAVVYWFALTELVEGVGGSFDWTVRGSGVA